MAQQVTFFQSLLESLSKEIQCLSRLSARDLRTNLGSNLNHIEKESGLSPWVFGGKRMRDELMKANANIAPEADRWRLEYLNQLLAQRHLHFYNGVINNEELESMIKSLVIY